MHAQRGMQKELLKGHLIPFFILFSVDLMADRLRHQTLKDIIVLTITVVIVFLHFALKCGCISNGSTVMCTYLGPTF